MCDGRVTVDCTNSGQEHVEYERERERLVQVAFAVDQIWLLYLLHFMFLSILVTSQIISMHV